MNKNEPGALLGPDNNGGWVALYNCTDPLNRSVIGWIRSGAAAVVVAVPRRGRCVFVMTTTGDTGWAIEDELMRIKTTW